MRQRYNLRLKYVARIMDRFKVVVSGKSKSEEYFCTQVDAEEVAQALKAPRDMFNQTYGPTAAEKWEIFDATGRVVETGTYLY